MKKKVKIPDTIPKKDAEMLNMVFPELFGLPTNFAKEVEKMIDTVGGEPLPEELKQILNDKQKGE